MLWLHVIFCAFICVNFSQLQFVWRDMLNMQALVLAYMSGSEITLYKYPMTIRLGALSFVVLYYLLRDPDESNSKTLVSLARRSVVVLHTQSSDGRL